MSRVSSRDSLYSHLDHIFFLSFLIINTLSVRFGQINEFSNARYMFSDNKFLVCVVCLLHIAVEYLKFECV